MEGDQVNEVYFIYRGKVAYVLPRFDNKPYKLFEKGQLFGHVEIAMIEEIFEENERALMGSVSDFSKMIIRRFTV